MHQTEVKTVQDVISAGNCAACGACAAACPVHAVTLTETAAGFLRAEISTDVCVHCGRCRSVCPSLPENAVGTDMPDALGGVCLAGYLAHASDLYLRRTAQSGGAVTALLHYLLHEKLVSGAYVCRMNVDTMRPETVWTDDPDVLGSCVGSQYAQSAALETIARLGNKNSAAVVLGCQAEALALMQKANVDFPYPAYTIGLVCAGQNSKRLAQELNKELLTEGSDACVSFRFRHKFVGGWPGGVRVETKTRAYSAASAVRTSKKPVYEAYRCLLCFDQMNVYSDIVCGDPWGLPRDEDVNIGSTVLIARTEKGRTLIENAVSEGFLVARPLEPEQILRGQTVYNRNRNTCLTAAAYCRKNGAPFPYQEGVLAGSGEREAVTRPFEKDIVERLRYTRTLAAATSEAEADSLIARRKRALVRQRQARKVRNILRKLIGR